MKKRVIIGISAIGLIVAAASAFLYWIQPDPGDPDYYPKIGNTRLLKHISQFPSNQYILVRWYAPDDSYFVIDDYNILKANKNDFVIRNKREAYFVTCETVFSLYKNGEEIASEICDTSGVLTEVDYGTLENQFKKISRTEFENMLHRGFPKNIVDMKVFDIGYNKDYKKMVEKSVSKTVSPDMIKRFRNADYHNEMVFWKGDNIGVAKLENGKEIYLRISNYGDFFAIAEEFGYYTYDSKDISGN